MTNKIILRFSIFLIVALASFSAIAQNSRRVYQSHKVNGNQLELVTNDGSYEIQFYNQNIVETAFIPKGEKGKGESTAVVLQPEQTSVSWIEKGNELQFLSEGMNVTISKSPFDISYSYKGRQLLSEKEGYVKTDSTENIDFTIDKDEVLFGGGARVLGMNHRGYRLQLYNRAHYGYGTHSELMNYTMPLVISSKMYAVNFDNAPIGYLDLDSKKTNTLRYESISGRKVYQVIASDTWEGFTYEFTNLTGRQPMLPRWSFGNFSSRFGYHSERECRATINQFLKDSIPVDAIILDLFWFGKEMKGEMGNLAFERDSFPTPEKMIADFEDKGVKTILITEPFILTTSKRWDEAVKEEVLGTDSIGNPYTYDFYFGNTGLVDVFKPKAIDWFWKIYKGLANKGIAGWWGDLGEPEVHPSALQHANGSADEVHNIYGHYWAKLIHDEYQEDFPDQRPFILMRAGAVGSQRYGMVPWTGDVSRSWDGLKPQTEISLQMGLQGIAYMHSDLGGFAGDNLDDELYTRWLQYGVFQPIFRPHAQEAVPSEPVFREAKTKALAKKSIQLRYQLMPYNYTLAFDNNQTGLPLMRPLFFEEQNNKELLSVSDTYMWGDAFLVSTITDAGLKEKDVYMPANSVWFDFVSGKKYEGGKSCTITTEEDHIPVFVRGGSFIPMIKGMLNSKTYSLENMELHYYHDKSVVASKGHLYNDDGTTPDAYEKGEYEILNFASKTSKSKLQIALNTETGSNYKSLNKNINWVILNIDKKPKKISLGKKSIDFIWDKESKTLRFKGNVSEGNQSVTIKLL
ncbi:glycosyl hydrolase [Labilibaculum manganireducens]|uniref:Glycosyl hydrolase n=1 Tax=Labilibaculum manganireducens TaxID=1940525 RepID=A0A2N3I121_9BACT|nr:TIM-barrel domain-containing protein [Labilibaculum manganireducens]PKQ64035.1 glycosyl hydrolase [Labilibaculum manganireducens]